MVKYSLALLLCATASGASAQQPNGVQTAPLLASETLLQVSAHGTIKAVPDRATLSTNVVTDGSSTEQARVRNAEVAQRLIAAARSAGVPEAALRTEALRVGPRFKPDKDGDDTDVIIGYRAQTRLSIKLRDMAMVARVYDALAGAGASGIDGPQFDFADDAPLKSRARAAAVAAAQAQAADYATPFGLHVSRILRISERTSFAENGQDIVVTASRANAATPPVLPGEQDVTADVWIDFVLTR